MESYGQNYTAEEKADAEEAPCKLRPTEIHVAH